MQPVTCLRCVTYSIVHVFVHSMMIFVFIIKECGTAMNCQQQTLSEFITTVAPGTKDILNHIGVQTKRY